MGKQCVAATEAARARKKGNKKKDGMKSKLRTFRGVPPKAKAAQLGMKGWRQELVRSEKYSRAGTDRECSLLGAGPGCPPPYHPIPYRISSRISLVILNLFVCFPLMLFFFLSVVIMMLVFFLFFSFVLIMADQSIIVVYASP